MYQMKTTKKSRSCAQYYWLGCNFTNPEDAARAYDRVARALRGPSTQPINFPLDPSDAVADMQLHLSETDPSGGRPQTCSLLVVRVSWFQPLS
jgi:hypothetical protein